MTYAKRTCNKCGFKRPQPEMVKRSESSFSASTSVHANKQGKRNGRLYSGKPRTVFYCSGCAPQGLRIVRWIIVGFLVWLVVTMFV